MAWSGGTFTRANPTWTTDASLGIGIEAGRHDAQDNDFTTGINQCLNKDGSNSATGNLNLGGFRYTNSAAATARTDLAQVAQVQDGDYIWLGTTGGTATAQTATATPAITAYKAGQKFRALVGAGLGSTGTNPVAHTLNINGIGAKLIINPTEISSPTNGTWVAGSIIELVYDGTYFRLINDPSNWQDYTLTTTNVTGTAPNVVSAVTAVEISRFIKIGKVVTWQFGIQFSLSAGGSSTINFNPPVNAAASIASTNAFWGNGIAYDTVLGTQIAGAYFISAANMKVFKNLLAGNTWSGGTTGNIIRMTMVYEGV